MPHKGPHISIAPDYVVNRILRVNLQEFEEWPEAVRRLAIEIAEELFLVAYNPFIDAAMVRASVKERFERESFALAHHYATSIGEGITMFWSAHEAETAFREELIRKLHDILPDECIISRPAALVECATDATDLRMELPLLVVEPENAVQVSALVRLANEMKFAVIPRGGASGYTGGAVPARKRSVIVSMTRCNTIGPIDAEAGTLTAGAGVITQSAIDAAAEQGFLFTVDPASKTASSIGGNVAENSGGPYAFEYGTTLDNLLSWRMVTPTGEIITVERDNHPRHKILPHEIAVFQIKDQSGGVRNVVELKGDEIRRPGLGKDVTNKALGGLPGVQKEGVDGIVIDATFVIHKKPALSRVVVLEFFGRSMHGATVVITELIALRDRIREEGDYAHMSALEEFNNKYVQAIEYKNKSARAESPISVLLLRFDADEDWLLDKCVDELRAIVAGRDDVEIIVAGDRKEAELFWEDRHRLSAIAKRTSGFKINEDIVIPTARIPDFALYLEQLNVECAGIAYRHALQAVGRLPGLPLEDKELNREFSFASKAAKGDVPATELSGEELAERAAGWLDALAGQHAQAAAKIQRIRDDMLDGRVIVASHMHAGDGNCHVNIPVNSNDLHMLETAEAAAARVMQTAKDMGGAVTGEHGVGITKIQFLEQEKIDEIRAFKERVDPREILNPAKLVQRDLPVRPFTFSFNRLIADIRESGLPNKENLIALLAGVQICTRCGKCKQVCPMVYPDRSFHYHPRNRNIALGALIEAIYYSQINTGKPEARLLQMLAEMIEHCTGCGRCLAVCPVKIPSADVALELRAFLDDENAGGHPFKERAMRWLSANPETRLPKFAKLASMGQKMQNRFIGFVPSMWRRRLDNPMFSGQGPRVSYTNIYETLKLDKGGIFVPERADKSLPSEAILYFPGCGAGLFARRVALAGLYLLLRSGHAVVVPEKHLCCGYPLLSSGMHTEFETNMERNRRELSDTVRHAREKGFTLTRIAATCGTCQEGLERHHLADLGLTEQIEITRFAMDHMPELATRLEGEAFVYQASCHGEVPGEHRTKCAGRQAMALERYTGASVRVSSGCCGESGTGAIVAPKIFNVLRERKIADLERLLPMSDGRPVLVGCPSCKQGIARSLIALKDHRPVWHTVEWLADLIFRPMWGQRLWRILRRNALLYTDEQGFRHVDIGDMEAAAPAKALDDAVNG